MTDITEEKVITEEQKTTKKRPQSPSRCTRTSTTDKDQLENKEDEMTEILTFGITVITPKKEKIELQVTHLDSIQDIRQHLLETPETCHITSYHLEYDRGDRGGCGNITTPLNDFSELSEIPDLKDGSTFTIVYDDYNETSARNHLRRLREILNMTPSALRKESPSLLTELTRQSPILTENHNKETNGKKCTSCPDNLPLNDYYPYHCNPPIKCLKKLVFSGWNPPPSHRRIQGDLFYLEVVTLEGNTHTITISPQKIFQNATKHTGVFNPYPTEHSAHTLVDLLRQISPKFKSSFAELLKYNFSAHPYESIPVAYLVKPWLAKPELPSYDPTRAEEELLTTAEVDYHIQGQLRDWNMELQLCREQPKETIQDRISRDRAMYKIHSEFVQAAVNGAVQIICGNVPPINPTDDSRAHLFIYNNIFYSHALDSRDFYKDLGGDGTAYKQASNDLLGIIAYNKADVKGLYTLGTVLIDFRGFRLVAQTIIPGLFSSLMQEGAAVNMGYGSLEGSDLKCHEDFHQLMLEAASKLFMKPHIVIGKDQSSAELASHSDIKGIIGSDQRKYILDLVRTTPRDSNYLEPTDIGALLRPELMLRYVTQQQAKANQDLPKKREEGKSKEEEKLSEELLKELDEPNDKLTVSIQANTDVFTITHLGGSEEEIEEDEALVRKLGDFLTYEVIPGLVEDIVLHRVNPIDSYTLTKLFHSRGINMRYLGTVAKKIQERQSKGSNFSLTILQREMIVRQMKRIFSDFLRISKPYNIATIVCHILNAFFGLRLSTYNKKGEKSGGTVQKSSPLKISKRCAEIAHNDLWVEIRKRVASKYDYALPEVIPLSIFTLPTLRAICQRVGIQMALNNYNLNAEKPFNVTDILSLYPVVKSSQPESVDGKELMEAAKVYSGQGRTDIAYELLSEALVVLHNVYGPMHEQTAQCYSNLAKILHSSDIHAAIQHQQKAVIIYERVCGLDHYETAHAYSLLGLLNPPFNSGLDGSGTMNITLKTSKAALIYLFRSMFLLNIASDPENIDHIDGYTNLGLALQDNDPKEAIKYLEKGLSLTESIYGSLHILTARLYHVLARVYSSINEFRTALKYESKNYEVCSKVLGDKDLRTIESNIFLGQLTKNAVKIEKLQRHKPHSKRLEALKAKRSDLLSSAFSSETTTSSLFRSDIGSDNDSLYSLPIDDILKIIQSSKKNGVSGKQKKNVSSPGTQQGQVKKSTTSLESSQLEQELQKRKDPKTESISIPPSPPPPDQTPSPPPTQAIAPSSQIPSNEELQTSTASQNQPDRQELQREKTNDQVPSTTSLATTNDGPDHTPCHSSTNGDPPQSKPPESKPVSLTAVKEPKTMPASNPPSNNKARRNRRKNK